MYEAKIKELKSRNKTLQAEKEKAEAAHQAKLEVCRYVIFNACS